MATEAAAKARKILDLQREFQALFRNEGKSGGALLRALDLLFEKPIITAGLLASRLEISTVTANKYLSRMVHLGIVREMTGYKRNRRYVFAPYLALFEA